MSSHDDEAGNNRQLSALSRRELLQIAAAGVASAAIPDPATFVPYGVWNNRTARAMAIWLPTAPTRLDQAEKYYESFASQSQGPGRQT